MRIVLLGPPGSGKGTQAAMLVKHLGVPHISTGAMLRDAAKLGTAAGLQAKKLTDRGELVPDDVMLGILEDRLNQPDVKVGFILDGYPRNLSQARSLEEVLGRLGMPADEAILIDIDSEEIIQRIAKRALKEGRSDDTEETVRHRLDIYEERTAPVADFYERKGILTRVWGEGSIDEIQQRILSVLDVQAETA